MEGVAAERTLRFLVKIDADLDEAERALGELKMMLDSISREAANIPIDLDGVREAIEQIEILKEQLASLDDPHAINIEVNMDFDPDTFLQKLNELMQGQDQTIHINVDLDEDSLNSLRDTLQNLGDNETVHVNVNFDVDREQIRGIQDLLSSVGEDQKITVHIDMDTITDDLDRMRRMVGEDTQRITIPVGFDVDLSDVEEVRIAVNRVSEMSGYALVGVHESVMADETIRDLRQKLQDFANETYTATLRINDDPAERDLEVFKATVGRHLQDLKITLDVEDLVAHAKITSLQEHLNEIERTFTAVLDVDNKRALDKIRYFLGRLDTVRSQIATATLGADGVPAQLTINNVTNNIRDYGRMRASAKLDVDAKQAQAEVAGMTTIIRRYQNRFGGSQGVRTRLTADISQALANIRLLESLLEHTEDDKRRVVIEAEITRAMAELETLREFAASVGAQDPTLQVGIRGAAVAAAEMLGLQSLADKLDGTGVDIKLDIDDRLSTALPNILGAFELQIQQFQTIATTFTAVTVPAIISGIAAIPAVAAAAAGAVGSLATAIAPGLVGAAGALGGALALGGASLAAFGAAVKSAGSFTWGLSQNLRQQSYQTKAAGDALKAAQAELAKTKKGTDAYTRASRAVTLAQINFNNESKNNKILLESVTPRIIHLARVYSGLSNELTRMKASMADAVAPFLITFFDAVGKAIKGVTPGLHNMIEQMGFVGSSFIKAYEHGQRLANLKQIFQGILDVGPHAMEALTNAIDILIGVLHVVVPSAVQVATKIQHMTSAAAGWVNSAKGQEVIAQVWKHMTNVAGQLWKIAVNLGKGLWGVIAALNASNTGTWLLDQIQKGAKWFADLMSASGDARQAITDFVNDTKPLLTAAGQLLAEVAKGVLHLIQVVRNQRGDSGKPFGVLIDVLNALKSLVPDVVGLLEHEFKKIGPLLPGLIKNIGEWATLFQRSTPEMIVFIKTITGLLAAFNALPQPVKIAIARTLAWAAAIKVLGGGALIGIAGSMAHLIAQFVIYRKIIGMLPGSTTKTGGALSKLRPIFDDIALRAMYAWDAIKAGVSRAIPALQSALSRLPGLFQSAVGKLRGSVGTIRTIFAQLGKGPLIEAGAAGVGAAALFGGWFLQIQQFRDKVVPLLEKLGPQMQAGVKKGMNTGDWSGVWDPLVKVFTEFGKIPVNPAEAVTKWLISPIDRLLKNWGIDIEWPWETRANNIQRSLQAIGKVAPFFSNLWQKIKNGVGPAWNAIKSTVSNAAHGIANAVGPALSGIGQRLAAAWRGLKGIAANAWNGIKNVVGGALRGLWAIVGPLVRRIAQGVAQAWRGLVNVARTIWNGIKVAIRAVVYTTIGLVLMAWDRVKPRLVAVWNSIKNIARNVWNGIRQTIANAWNRVKQIFGPTLNYIKKVILAAWSVTKNRTQQVWNGIKNFLSGVWNRIKGIFRGGGAISRILQAAWQRVRNITTTVWNAIRNFLRNAWNNIKKIVLAGVAVTKARLQQGWNTVKRVTSTVWNAIRNFLRNTWNQIKKIAGPAVNFIRNQVRNGWNFIKRITSTVWNAIKNAIRNAWNQIKRIFGPAIKAITNTVRNGWNQIKRITSTVWNAVKNFLRNVWNQIKQVVSPAVKAVGNVVRNGWNLIRNVTRTVWNAIKSAIQAAWRVIRSVVQGGIRVVSSVLRAGWNAIRNLVRSAWNQIVSAVRSGINGMRNAISAGFHGVMSFISSMVHNFYVLGHNLIVGLINGIKSMAGQVGSTIGNLLVNAYNRGKQAVQSRSPSKLFERGLGHTIPQGIAKGVAGKAIEAIRAVQTMTRGLFQNASRGVDALRALGKAARVAGRNIVMGLTQGVGEASSQLVARMRQIAQAALNAARSTLQIRSPSRPMIGFGINTVQGLIVGAWQMLGPLKERISTLFRKGILDPLNSAKGVDTSNMVKAEGGINGLRQQQKAMQNMMRMHRMMERSYAQLARSMTASARMQSDALRSVEMQMRRNAALQASMARQRADAMRLGAGTPNNANMGTRRFHATPPREAQAGARREGIRTAQMRRDRLDVYVHTDGDGARHIDNQDLADRITTNLHRERRRN